jgi:hypothetical protein
LLSISAAVCLVARWRPARGPVCGLVCALEVRQRVGSAARFLMLGARCLLHSAYCRLPSRSAVRSSRVAHSPAFSKSAVLSASRAAEFLRRETLRCLLSMLNSSLGSRERSCRWASRRPRLTQGTLIARQGRYTANSLPPVSYTYNCAARSAPGDGIRSKHKRRRLLTRIREAGRVLPLRISSGAPVCRAARGSLRRLQLLARLPQTFIRPVIFFRMAFSVGPQPTLC